MRLVLFDGGVPQVELPGFDATPPQAWKPCAAAVPVAYVAFDPAHLQRYARWFPGLVVRVDARLRDRPLPPGAALVMPVTYNSWAVVIDGPDAFGAAVEAARSLNVAVLACPQLPHAPAAPAPRHRRSRDLVLPLPA